MRSRYWLLGICLAALLLPGTALAQGSVDTSAQKDADEGWITLKTAYKAAKEMPFFTPGNAEKSLSGTLPLPSKQAIGVDAQKYKIGFDFNGDSKMDAYAKGSNPLQSLVLTYEDGTRAPYQIALSRQGASWRFKRSCYRMTSYKGDKIVLIDNDSDGKYDGKGDALVIGRSTCANGMSSMVSLKGQLYQFRVNSAGTQVQLKPVDGETGKVKLVRGHRASGKLAGAVIGNGSVSFNAATRGIALPPGTYTMSWGVLSSGRKTAEFTAKTSVTIEAGKTAEIKWGGPFKIEFQAKRNGDKITVSPYNVKIIGAAGEKYTKLGPRPVAWGVEVVYTNTGKKATSGKMGTS